MNVDLKLLVRLLLAILVVSLISTLFLGKHIHKHIIESVKKQDHKSKEIHSETKISKNISSENPTEVYLESPLQISTEIITNYQTEKLIGTENADTITAKKFDDLKIRKNAWLKLLQKKGDRRDWHNRHAMARDSRRKGLGEVGRGASIPNRKPFGNTLLGLHGFQAQLSDLISVNRSLPDIKPARCHIIKYLKILPNATVVISFHNEHLSVLLRSIHSLVNRSPKELLPEIILVDDASNLPNLGQNLVDYVAKAFGKRVSLVRLAKRCGLIRARMEGARRATCQVLIFLDSHIEVTHNWLPPLLEPIAIHRTIATGPIVDEISRETFAYNLGSVLTRSGFDWRFHIKHLPRFNDDSWDPSSPYRTPLLVGALAIDRRYFWELGGYDEELDIWGGELLEMGFKIWMCGGMMIYIPCSRVGHISRGPVLKRSSPRNYNYLGRNYKRVAEVWMDDYKKFIYERNPELFHNVNVGNLTTLKALRKHLKCKSFNWYMTKVAPDFLEKFPTVEKPPLASGLIQSLAEPSLCLDVLNGEHNHPVGLARCTNPVDKNQDWTLTQDHEIRLKSGNVCLEQSGTQAIKDVMLYHCHSLGGNQFWYYNPMLKWFQEGEGWYRCLEAILPKGSTPGGVISSYCDKSNIRQKWNFGGL